MWQIAGSTCLLFKEAIQKKNMPHAPSITETTLLILLSWFLSIVPTAIWTTMFNNTGEVRKKCFFKRMFIYIVFTNKMPLFLNHITYLFEHNVCCLIILYNCVVSAHYLTLLLSSYFVPLLAVHCHLSCLMVSGKVIVSKSEALCQVLPDSPLHARCPLTLVLWRSSHGYFGHWEIMTTFFRC